MDRVDQHEVRALPYGPGPELGQVRDIADPPGPLGPHGVELRRESPGPVVLERGRQLEPLGRDDDGGAGGAATVIRDLQLVVTERQVTRQLHGELRGRHSVDITRTGALVMRTELANYAVFQSDPSIDGFLA